MSNKTPSAQWELRERTVHTQWELRDNAAMSDRGLSWACSKCPRRPVFYGISRRALAMPRRCLHFRAQVVVLDYF